MSQENFATNQVPSQNNPTRHDDPARYDDEIDLTELFRRIWRTKWRVMIALVIVASAYITVQAIKILGTDTTTTYSYVFDLTFEGLQDGVFPDGSRFQISDIVSPTVLSRVYHHNQLERYNLSLDQFRRAIVIEPYAPEAQFIRQRYQQQLSDRKLSPNEIQELQDRMLTELHLAQSGAVRLSFVSKPDFTIPVNVIQKVLIDIANTWATRSIDELGVLQLSVPIYSPRIFDEQRFQELDYLLSIEMLLENIGLIESNINSLQSLPHAANAYDPETGFNLQDLKKAIRDVANYDLRQLMDPIKELGLTKNPDIVNLYYAQQLRELEREKVLWKERARVTKEVMVGFARDEMSPSDATQVMQSTITPQLGDAFLDRLVEISRHGSAQEFRQALAEKILEYENNALDIQQRIDNINLIMEALNRSQDENMGLRDIYIKEVEERLPRVLSTMRDYAAVVNRLHEQLSRQATGSISEIIQLQGGSFEISAPWPIGRQDLLYFLALMVATGFISLFGCLVYDAMLRREKN